MLRQMSGTDQGLGAGTRACADLRYRHRCTAVFGLDRSNRRRLAATQSSPPDVITLIITRSGWSAWLRHAADTPSPVKTLSVAVFRRRCGGRRYWLRIVAE